MTAYGMPPVPTLPVKYKGYVYRIIEAKDEPGKYQAEVVKIDTQAIFLGEVHKSVIQANTQAREAIDKLAALKPEPPAQPPKRASTRSKKP